MFFFEKKNQKTFAPLRACVPPSLSHKKSTFFYCFFVHKKAVKKL